MKLLFALVLFLQVVSADATERLPLAHRTALAQGPLKEASSAPVDHAWKLSLLGLAALSFLIRKRL